MKSHKIMAGGWVKLQPDLHIEEIDLTWHKLVNNDDGSYTTYRFSESQQEMIANCLNAQIESLVNEHMDSMLQYARNYVGQGKLEFKSGE